MRRLFSLSFCICVLLQMNAFAARTAVPKQSVEGGTTISASGENTLVDAECSDSYFGCMDSFCMVENVSGGRCQCSNKHTDLSKQFDDLLKKQEEAENISQYGADFVKIANVKSDIEDITNNAKNKTQNSDTKNKLPSRAEWDAMFAQIDDEDEEDVFVDTDDISNKHGDALYIAADEMCFDQTPSKCKENSDMLKMLYVQKIKTDCTAFENTIKKGNSALTVQIADAQKVVRDAALSKFKEANKYGLGQCVREFKTCMQTTAGCGKGFDDCVILSANENVSKDGKQLTITGEMVDTMISGTTMDNLISKKVLCESVLENCVNVKDNVWDAFLTDIAPVVKTAELNAEDNLRSNCVANVAQCYLKACREHFDVNEEGGSYDMCLSRPENYKSFCKIELEPCLIATGGSYEKPSESRLWNGILSELASQRTTACTKEFKACIQDDDRCGSDYSKCIGLDADDIAMMCPDDKLTACYHEYEGKKESVRETLARVASHVMLSVNTALSDACENAVSEAMEKYCGNENDCSDLITQDGVGEHTLEIKYCESVDGEYTNCKDDIDEILETDLGKKVRNSDLSISSNEKHYYSGVITGQILWDQIKMLPDYSGIMSGEDYINSVKDIYFMDKKVQEKVKTEIGSLGRAIKNAISVVESDPRVQFCMTGRQVAGLTGDNGLQQYIGKTDNPVFPNMTQSVRIMIINSALLKAQENYNKKREEILKDYVENNSKLQQRYDEIRDANYHLDVEDIARKKCIALGERAAFTDKKSGKGAKNEIVREGGNDDKLVGYSSESTFKLKVQVTTNFSIDTMTCTKCTRTQKCKTVKKDWCKKWGDEEETCEEIQY